MSNPFKVGDKVVSIHGWGDCPMTVTRVDGDRVWTDGCVLPAMPATWRNLRAAIAGMDYPLPWPRPAPTYAPNTGHLSDGSSVQKHSAGGLYPCVLVYRDKKIDVLSMVGKYDVGVISPRNQEPIWFADLDRAVAVAEAIKEAL